MTGINEQLLSEKRQLVARPGPTLTSYVVELLFFLLFLEDLRRRVNSAWNYFELLTDFVFVLVSQRRLNTMSLNFVGHMERFESGQHRINIADISPSHKIFVSIRNFARKLCERVAKNATKTPNPTVWKIEGTTKKLQRKALHHRVDDDTIIEKVMTSL